MKPIQPFIAEWQGKKAPDQFGGYVGQCVSLVKQFLLYQGWPELSGNAIQWQHNGYGAYVWYPNTPKFVPVAGDLAVFDTPTVHPDDGHIGIVVSANVKTMQVFNQNYPHGNLTDPATTTTFNYLKPVCLGFIRHK